MLPPTRLSSVQLPRNRRTKAGGLGETLDALNGSIYGIDIRAQGGHVVRMLPGHAAFGPAFRDRTPFAHNPGMLTAAAAAVCPHAVVCGMARWEEYA